jgi:hypothetical protein
VIRRLSLGYWFLKFGGKEVVTSSETSILSRNPGKQLLSNAATNLTRTYTSPKVSLVSLVTGILRWDGILKQRRNFLFGLSKFVIQKNSSISMLITCEFFKASLNKVTNTYNRNDCFTRINFDVFLPATPFYT